MSVNTDKSAVDKAREVWGDSIEGLEIKTRTRKDRNGNWHVSGVVRCKAKKLLKKVKAEQKIEVLRCMRVQLDQKLARNEEKRIKGKNGTEGAWGGLVHLMNSWTGRADGCRDG